MSTGDTVWDACAELLRRADIRGVTMGWTVTAGAMWWAAAEDHNRTRLSATGLGPVMALAAVTERVALTTRCGCGRPIAISDRAIYAYPNTCRWRLHGHQFRPDHNGYQKQKDQP